MWISFENCSNGLDSLFTHACLGRPREGALFLFHLNLRTGCQCQADLIGTQVFVDQHVDQLGQVGVDDVVALLMGGLVFGEDCAADLLELVGNLFRMNVNVNKNLFIVIKWNHSNLQPARSPDWLERHRFV